MKLRACIIIFIYLIIGVNAFAQVPETYYECRSNWFFQGAAQTATFNGSLLEYFSRAFENRTAGLKGFINLQVLIDTNGAACCTSINNITRSDISNLSVRSVVEAMPAWQPAIHYNMKVKFAADINIHFTDTGLMVRYQNENRRHMDFAATSNKTNNPQVITDNNTKSTWKNYSYSNSMLPGNFTSNIKIDSKGVIWYASVVGIARIDGDQWTIFNGVNTPEMKGRERNTWISNMDIDDNDNLWVISFDDLLKYDRKTWTKFENVHRGQIFFRNIATAKDGSTWFATPMGLVQFDGRTSTPYNKSNSKIASDNIKCVYIDKEQAIWLATDSGINKFHQGEWTLYNSTNSPLTTDKISYITGDKQGNIWAGTDDLFKKNILIKIDQGNGIQIFPSAMIADIEIDPTTQHIWLATSGKGLVHFDGKKFSSYTNTNSPLGTSTLNELAIDKKGHKWLGTYKGLMYTTLQ